MTASRVLVNGNQLATQIIAQIQSVIQLERSNHPAFYQAFPQWSHPRLDIVNVGFHPASLSYIKKKIDLATSIGIKFTLHQFLQNPINQEAYHNTFKKIISTAPCNCNIRHFSTIKAHFCYNQIANLINDLNKTKEVSGILLQLPLRPLLIDYTKQLIEQIDPDKDVDCLSRSNRSRCIEDIRPRLMPCTPSGVLQILDRFNVQVKGKRVIMVGRSSLVGLPLFHLLLNRDATITLCHSQTQNLQQLASQADIVIAAVGKPNLIKHLKPGSVAIDIGISRDGEGRLCGDISEEAKKVCSLATPVPGGVGPLTVAMLMSNTVWLWQQQMMLQRIRLGFDKLPI